MAAAVELGGDVLLVSDSDDELDPNPDDRPDGLFESKELDQFLQTLNKPRPTESTVKVKLGETPSAAATTTTTRRLKAVRREIDGPRILKCLNEHIRLASSARYFKALKFEAVDAGEKPQVAALTALRIPDQLTSCYSSDKTSAPESEAPPPPKAKRWCWRGRGRMSLLDQEPDWVDCDDKKLDPPTQLELRHIYDEFFPSRQIPFVFSCGSSTSTDCRDDCARRTGNFSLYMELRSGRPWSDLVRQNVANIRPEDSTVVDDSAAAIAATAVRHKHQPPSRLFVPVSADLTRRMNCVKFPQLNLLTTAQCVEVHSIVDDLVKFVERQFDFKELKHDPESSPDVEFPEPTETSPKLPHTKREKNRVIRELKRLANVSVSDERSEDEVSDCGRPSCRLGCVCGSLRERPVRARHCAQIDCMFECGCGNELGRGSADWEGLAKIEKTWHQTVIRKNNDDVELQSYDRTKRETKLPSRYVGPDFFGDRVRMRRTPFPDPNQPVAPKRRRRGPKVATGPVVKKFQMTKEDVTAVHVRACKNHNAATLADVNIWCTVHTKFDCFCTNWIIFSKWNRKVYKPWPSNQTSLVTNLMKSPLGPVDESAGDVQLYNLSNHSARTADPIVLYATRNSLPEYGQLVRASLETGFLSYSNGFVKARPTFRPYEDPEDPSPPARQTIAPSSGEPSPAILGEVVRLTTTTTDEEVDIGGGVAPVWPRRIADEEFPITIPKSDLLDDEDEIVSDSDSSSSIEFVENEPEEPTVISDDDVDSPPQLESPVAAAAADHSDDAEYPKLGLLCLSSPEMGYVVVKHSSPGSLIIETPTHPDGICFKSIEMANLFMKGAVRAVELEPVNADWVMVTRGVLEKYQSRKFDFATSRPRVDPRGTTHLRISTGGPPHNLWGPRVVKKNFFLTRQVEQKSPPDCAVHPETTTIRATHRLEVGQRFPTDHGRGHPVRLVRLNPHQPHHTAAAPSPGGVRAVLVSKSPGFIKVSPTWAASAHDAPVIVDTFGNPLHPPKRPRLHPPRADVIVPRRNGFPALLSPSSVADTSVAQDQPTAANFGIKGYICVKKQLTPTTTTANATTISPTSSPYRSSLLPNQ